MKKLIEKRRKFLKIFGILMFVAICAMSYFSAQGNTGKKIIGATMASTLFFAFPKELGLTDKEEKAFEIIGNALNSEMEKREKGYISETKFNENVNSLMQKFIKENGIDATKLKELEDALKAQGLKINEVTEKTIEEKFNLKNFVSKGFKEESVQSKLKVVASNTAGKVDVMEVKAVGNITTGSVTTTTSGNALLDLVNTSDVSDARFAATFIEQYATVTNTSNAVVPYADVVPKDGDVGFVGEAGSKAQVDFKLEVRYATPKKAAGHEILTTESVQDIPRMQSIAQNVLVKKYLLKRQYGILFGDGNGDNPTGVTTIAAAFNPASWTGEKIKQPNLLDVIRAAANQIYTSQSWADDVEFMPNVVFVNPADLAAFKGTKTTEGMYVFPQFNLGNETNLDGLVVIAKNKIPAGKILIGDFTKLNIVNYINYSVSVGWINDQFIKNLFTMVGEGRFFVYVKEYEKRAFIYDDIATIKAGILAENA